MISEELKDWADSAVTESNLFYTYDGLDWMIKHCSKKEVQKVYSIRKADINKVYDDYKDDYLNGYPEDEAKEAIRTVMVEWAETEVASRLEAGYTAKSMFRGVTDEEHAKYALENILTGK